MFMGIFTRFRSRLKSLLGRDRLERDLEDELTFHLALKAEK